MLSSHNENWYKLSIKELIWFLFNLLKITKGKKAVKLILNMISVNILVCKFSVAATTSQSPFWQVFTLNVNADLIFSVLWKCRRMKILIIYSPSCHPLSYSGIQYRNYNPPPPPHTHTKNSQYIANRGVTHSRSLKTRQNEHDSKPCDPSLWINVPWRETRCVWEKY